MGVVQRALAFRKEQEEQLGWSASAESADAPRGDGKAGCAHCQAKKLGDVTTLNVTMLRSGISLDGGRTFSLNVIPTQAEAGFDVRIAPSLATADFRRMLDEWCAGEGLSWQFAPWVNTLEEHYVTSTHPNDTPLFGVMEDVCAKDDRTRGMEAYASRPPGQRARLLGA